MGKSKSPGRWTKLDMIHSLYEHFDSIDGTWFSEHVLPANKMTTVYQKAIVSSLLVTRNHNGYLGNTQ